MSDFVDNFSWIHSLECPPDTCTGPIKKILYKGMLGLLWDNLNDVTFPIAEAKEIRKNILLSKLKSNSSDPAIKGMKSMMRLISEKNTTDVTLSQLEEEYERQNIQIKEKLLRLRKMKSVRISLKAKKDILGLKRDQISTQFRDCKDMRLVCQYLMPSTRKNLSVGATKDCLRAVATVWSGADKKEVWQIISNTLGSIETTILWERLQHNLTQDVNGLIESGKGMDSAAKENFSTISENMDVAIGTACGQHVEAVIRRLTCRAKAEKLQRFILGFIQQIEERSSSDGDLSEWLALALEVRKLEAEQACLQNEVDRIKKGMDDSAAVTSTLAQIMSHIQTIDSEMEKCVRDVQQSLALLKSAGLHLNKIREKLRQELQKITVLQNGNNAYKWLRNKLSTELNVFYNDLNLSALRKVMLKGSIGNYRHTKFCISEASVTISALQYPDIVSHFPAIHIPVYFLMNCYKNLATNFLYKKSGCRLTEDRGISLESLDWNVPEQKKRLNTLELFGMSKQACEKAREEIDKFHSVLNAWCTQHVQEISVLTEMSVDGIPFSVWLQRYSLLLYMIQTHV